MCFARRRPTGILPLLRRAPAPDRTAAIFSKAMWPGRLKAWPAVFGVYVNQLPARPAGGLSWTHVGEEDGRIRRSSASQESVAWLTSRPIAAVGLEKGGQWVRDPRPASIPNAKGSKCCNRRLCPDAYPPRRPSPR